MDKLSQIKEIYTKYIQTVEELEKNRKITDGILGFGGGPADHPCHDQFAKELEASLGEGMDSSEVFSVLQYIYTIPLEHQDPASIYWMLLAVQGLTVGLTASLTAEDAEKLRRQFEKDYPRWGRLPCQKQVLAGLKAAGKR